MILGYLIIGTNGMLISYNFFTELNVSRADLNSFASGMSAVDIFLNATFHQGVEEVISKDMKFVFEKRKNFVTCVIGSKHNQMILSFAKKIADALEDTPLVENHLHPDVSDEINKIIEERGITKEIKEINESFKTMNTG